MALPSSSSSLWNAADRDEGRSPHQQLAELYREHWNRTYPDGKCILSKRHFIMFAEILKALHGDTALATSAISRFLADRSLYAVERRHPIELFRQDLSKYTTNGVPRAPAPGPAESVVAKRILN